MAELGNLSYKLSLDKSQFDKDIAKVREALNGLANQKVTLSGINQNSLKAIQKAINEAEFKIKNVIVDGEATRANLQRQINSIANELSARIDLIVTPKVGGDGGAPSVEQIVEVVRRAKDESGKLNSNVAEGKRHIKDATNEATKFHSALSGASRQANSLEEAFKNLKPVIGDVFSLYALKRFLDGLIDIGGEIQKQRMALGHIIGNDSNANILFNEMKDLAVKSPFGLLDLMKNARQLSAFGVEYNNLYDTMRRLSDVAAGLGIEFGRLSLVYGETMERGFLDGKLVRQFSYMGLPVLQKIAEYYTEIHKNGQTKIFDASEVRKMVSQRQVSFEDVDAVIQRMTDAGGQFANMQEVMAESVAGKWKNLRDAIDILYSDITEGNSALLKYPAELMTNIVKNYKAFEGVLLLVAARMVGAKAASMLYTAALGKETSAVYANLAATKAANVQNQLRVSALNGANASMLNFIASTKALTAADLADAVAKGKLTESEARLLATKLAATKANAGYLLSQGLITRSQYAWIMSNNALVSSLGRARVGFSMLGTQVKILAAEFKAAAMAMLTNPMTWVFAVVGAVAQIYSYFSGINEERDKIAKGFTERTNSLRNDAGNIEETVKLSYDDKGKIINDTAEIQTAIETLVTFIKNDVPGAQEILNKAFEVDENTHIFKNSLDERYKILKDFFDKYKNMINDSELEKVGEVVQDAFEQNYFLGWQDNLMEDAKDYEDAYKEAKRVLMNVLANADAELEKMAAEYRKKLGAKNNMSLIEALLKPENSAYFYHFSSKHPAMTSARRNLESQYEEYAKELDKTKTDMNNKLKGVYGSNFSPDKMNEKQKHQVEFAINTQLTQSEASEFVTSRMAEEFKTKWNIDITMGGDVPKVDSIWKQLYGEKIPVGDNDNIYEVIDTARKTKKAAKEELKTLNKDKKMKSLLALSKKEDSTFDLSTLKEADKTQLELKRFGEHYNEQLSKLNNAQYVLDREGVGDDDKDKGSGSKTDKLLEEWKEKFDKLKKTYAEFEKWKKLVGADAAGKKVSELGLMNEDALAYFGLSEKDLNDPQKYSVMIENFYGKIKSKLTTTARRKWAEALPVEVSGIELDISKETIQKFTDNVKSKLDTALKQFDIWKIWFNETGDSDFALKMAVNITPIWDDKAKWLKDAFEKQARNFGLELDFGYSMTDEQAKNFFTGDKSALLDFYKQVRDAFHSGGYEAAKEIADAIKGALTTTEKVAAVNAKYDRLVENDRQLTGGANKRILESQRSTELEKLSPEYKQFFASVTSMTKAEARAMGDSIKSNLLSQLANGVISMDEYAQAVKKVDDQITKSVDRINSLGEAILLGKEGTFYNQRYDEAKYEQAMATENLSNVKRDIEKNAMSGNLISAAEIQRLFDATMRSYRADNKVAKTGKDLEKYQERSKDDTTTSAFLTKSQKAIQGLQMFADTLDSCGVELGSFGDMLDVGGAMVSGAQQGSQIASLISGAGPYGAAAGAALSMVSSIAAKHDEALEKEIEASKQRVKIIEKVADAMKTAVTEALDATYHYTNDERTKNKLNEIANDFKWVWVPDGNGNTKQVKQYRYSEETRQSAEKALEDSSFFSAQQALLKASIEENEKQLASEKDKKKSDSGKIADYEQNIQDAKDKLRDLAKDFAKDLFNIDFKQWAQELSDALVSAWANGENAVKAYQDAVSSMLKSVMTSVVQQKYVESLLLPLANQFYEQFEKDKGLITNASQNLLAEMYNKAQDATRLVYQGMDAMEQVANQHGNTLKGWESNVGNSIQGVTEETADILASYMNGMRNDLSIQRMSVEAIHNIIADERYGMERQCALAQSQLAQLEMIASNTHTTMTEIASVRATLDDVVSGTKQVHIS